MSGLNDQDARALTYLALRIRAETYGAGPWDEHGTYANVAKLAGRSLALTTEMIVSHAADPKAKSPGVLLGSYTPPKPSDQPKAAARPLKRAEQCPRCGGRKGACACRLEHLAATYDDETPAERMDRMTALQAARAALVAAKGAEIEPTEETA